MSHTVTKALSVAAVAAMACGAHAASIFEDFDPFTGSLAINKTDDPVVGFAADPLDATNTMVEITMQGGDEAVLLTADLGAGTFFEVSARVAANDTGQLEIDFSNGGFGLTAAGSANEADTLENNPFLADTGTSGYKLLIQSNFSDTQQRLVLRQNGADLASSDILGDLTDSFDQYDVLLTLTGTTQANGDVELIGTLLDNLGGDDNTTVQATVPAASVEIGTDYGIAQLKYGSGNPSRALFDDVSITVIPEPSSLLLLAGAMASAMRRCRR
ncbi:MAG: PEP-CTERM sorting domain-containing protein [Planctomycetota bacterium]